MIRESAFRQRLAWTIPDLGLTSEPRALGFRLRSQSTNLQALLH